jgi:uncharacterized membrane protein YhaH (DUF805 family)
MSGQWPDPAESSGPPGLGARLRRQQVLGRVLVVLVTVVGVLAVATLVTPGELSDQLAVITVAALIAAPVIRVAWLAVRWLRLGDRRFALVSLALLVVVGVAALV